MHIIYIYIYIYIYSVIIKIGVMQRGSLLHEDLLLVLLDDFLVLLFVDGHELYQLMIYMHKMMMQYLVI